MKAQIVRVTPEVAINYLKSNKKNRGVDKRKVEFYSSQMKNGEWKENGESIIFDTKGILKDGQHRLLAVISSKKSFLFPIITGVSSDVMPTIDTGKNRSLADILTLNNFKYATTIAAVAVKILKGTNRNPDTKRSATGISNSKGLDFCTAYEEELINLVKTSTSLYKKSAYKILTTTEIAYLIHLIGGFNFKEVHVNFMKHVLGIRINEGSGSQYLHKKLFNSKINKDPLNKQWVKAIFIKAYNQFIDGDAPVSYLQYDLTKPMPKVNQLIQNNQ